MDERHRLCYVDGNCAYFTTREPFTEQWGDDWNDAPYEHNAGSPYHWTPSDGARDVPQYEIGHVYIDGGNLETPADIAYANSRYSVEMINGGAAAWLTNARYRGTAPLINIAGGTTYPEFVRLVQAAGGTVYAPLEAPDAP